MAFPETVQPPKEEPLPVGALSARRWASAGAPCGADPERLIQNRHAPAPPSAASPEGTPPSIPDERVEVTAAGFQPSRIDVGTQRREALSPTTFTLLLCGRFEDWQDRAVRKLADKYAGLLEIKHLGREGRPGVLLDSGDALARLGVSAPGDVAHI